MNRREAKRLDDESLARTFLWQIQNRPQRERVEAFGRYLLQLTAEAMRTLRMPEYGAQLQEALEVQEPGDTGACERLLGLMHPGGPMNEESFQRQIEVGGKVPHR